MSGNITVVVLRPGQPGSVEEIPATLEAFQRISDGYVTMFHDPAAACFVYVDEDGDLKVLERNKQIGAHDVVGTAVFCCHQGDEMTSLTPELVARVKALYG